MKFGYDIHISYKFFTKVADLSIKLFSQCLN